MVSSVSAQSDSRSSGSVAPSPLSAGSGSRGAGSSSATGGEQNVWAINDPASAITLDHRPWDRFLKRYVVTDEDCLNRVCYGDVTCCDHKRLHRYLRYLQSVDTTTLNREEQMAYWFNLYNAKMVDIVLDNYRVRSVLKIKQDLFDLIGPFDDKTLCVMGKSLSLSDVENEIVRPVYGDPRIHYALNCASVGCPNLKKSAWRAETLDKDLDRAAYKFINSGRAVKSKALGRLWASKIYDWYKDDFGGDDKGVIRHLKKYARPELRAELCGECKIDKFSYNWSLNGCGHHNFSWVNLLLP